MNKLKPCPFCGKSAHVEKHVTAIGNESFQVQHLCKSLLSDLKTFCYPSEAEAIATWNRRPEPRRLTLEELKQMEGQPVWTRIPGGDNWDCEIVCGYEEIKEIINMCSPSYGGNYSALAKNYGITWLAYDRPPGGRER